MIFISADSIVNDAAEEFATRVDRFYVLSSKNHFTIYFVPRDRNSMSVAPSGSIILKSLRISI